MTNEQLVIRIKAEEDVAGNMEILYQKVRRFIHAIAWKYRNYEEVEDLEQEGYLALYSAIDGYDPEQGTKFLTYAEYHIRQRMQRYIQNNGGCLRLPVHCMERIQKYKRLCNAFMLKNGRKPTDRESAYYLGFTLEQVEGIRENACMARLSSLDSPIPGAEDESLTLSDTLSADIDLENEVVEEFQYEQLKRELWACVDALDGRQADVVRMRYQDSMTLLEIGNEYGVTREAVRQVHSKALRELRKPRYSKRLRPFLEEERIYSLALVGNGVERFNHSWTSSTERTALKMVEE